MASVPAAEPEPPGPGAVPVEVNDDWYAAFVADTYPRLARALVAAFGVERGQEAVAEAFAWGWEHRNELRVMANPLGYLYRVGQSRSRPRKRPSFPVPDASVLPWVEPGLPAALGELTEQQRVCLVLAHAYGWTHREVADLLELRPSSVQNHIERGLAKLRLALGVATDA